MTDSVDDTPDFARRTLLKRIGLAGATIYTAPTLTHLGVAHAGSGGGGGGGGSGGGGGGSGGGGSGGSGGAIGSGSSGPSGPSGPSGASGPSGPSGRADNSGGDRGADARRTGRTSSRDAAPAPEIVLFLPTGTDVSQARAAGYSVRAQASNTTLGGSLYRLRLPSGRSLSQGRAKLSALIPNGKAEENHYYTPDDFLCDGDGCAAHAMIGWSGWPSVYAPRIGMIDTGINSKHQALHGQNLTVHQADLGGRQPAGRKHGTAIAAMLVGRLDYRVPGLLPNAELVAVEAFHAGSQGDQADVFSLASAVDILLDAKVAVINMSFSGPKNAILEDLVKRATIEGVAVVAAAGNNGPGAEPAYPAAYEKVLAVTAVDVDGKAYRQANRGPYINFSAPGVRLWAAASISGGRLKSGTSYAAPFVTASLAVQRMRAPALPLKETVDEMARCARDLGEPGFDPIFGYGLVAAPGQCFADDAQSFPVAGE